MHLKMNMVCSVCLIQIALYILLLLLLLLIIPEINISNFKVFGCTAKVRDSLVDQCRLENEMVFSQDLLIKSYHCSACYLGN